MKTPRTPDLHLNRTKKSRKEHFQWIETPKTPTLNSSKNIVFSCSAVEEIVLNSPKTFKETELTKKIPLSCVVPDSSQTTNDINATINDILEFVELDLSM